VLRINADHARATAFLINDGVLPSKKARLRAAQDHARRDAQCSHDGTTEPYLYQLTGSSPS